MQKFEDKYDLLNRAYRDEKLKKGSIALLQYLVHKSNQTHCFPAVDTIAAALGCCRRTVQYNMRKLERAGYIIRKDRWYNHQQLSNQYCFAIGITEDKVSTKISSESNICKELGRSFKGADVSKAQRIKEIYTSNLSAGEKLLLINFCFRANQKGIVYGTADRLKKGLGMRGLRPGCIRDNFYQWMIQLREKGLIDIKTVYINRKKYLIIHIREVDWNKITNHAQPADHKTDVRREQVSNLKISDRKKCFRVDRDETRKHGNEKNIQYALHKMKIIVSRVWEKVHKILRI